MPSEKINKGSLIIILILLTILSLLLIDIYIDTNHVKKKHSEHYVKTYLERVEEHPDIIIHEQTIDSISFRILDGSNKPNVRSGMYLKKHRSNLKDACDTFNPKINCIECNVVNVSYSIKGSLSFVEVQNIPIDHYEETVESISYLLLSYMNEVRLDNR